MADTWGDHERALSNITPKFLTCLHMFPITEILRALLMGPERPIIVHCVFLVLI